MQIRYRKPTNGIKFKRHKGTFSLSNQVVLNPFTQEVKDKTKVSGIRLDKQGTKIGHIKEGNVIQYVKALGVRGWEITREPLL